MRGGALESESERARGKSKIARGSEQEGEKKSERAR